jgi:hypothetical protein
VAALGSIAGYRLSPIAPRIMRDRYLDTGQRALAARRIALRRRAIADGWLVTVKGPPRPASPGLSRRLELEAPWSPEALGRIVDALRAEGVTLPRLSGSTGAPLEAARSLGLRVVQDRETHRRPRVVTRVDDPRGAALAELAVDAVAYRIEAKIVRLYQVEVEARSADAAPAVRAIMDRLAAQFAPALRPWPYGKLATGEAITRLLRAGDLDGALGADGALLRAGIQRVWAVLDQGPGG